MCVCVCLFGVSTKCSKRQQDICVLDPNSHCSIQIKTLRLMYGVKYILYNEYDNDYVAFHTHLPLYRTVLYCICIVFVLYCIVLPCNSLY